MVLQDDKARIVEETLVPDALVSEIAKRGGLSPQQVFTWRRQTRRLPTPMADDPPFVPAVVDAMAPIAVSGQERKTARRKAKPDVRAHRHRAEAPWSVENLWAIESSVGGIPYVGDSAGAPPSQRARANASGHEHERQISVGRRYRPFGALTPRHANGQGDTISPLESMKVRSRRKRSLHARVDKCGESYSKRDNRETSSPCRLVPVRKKTALR